MTEIRRRRSLGAPVQDDPETSKRPSIWSKMKAKPNWDDDTGDELLASEVDRLAIPQHIVSALARDGVALQWVTRSVRGQDAPQEIARFRRGGWTPVNGTDFDGILDGLFMPKGTDDTICVEDCMLVARPIAIHEKAKARDRRAADEPLRIKVAELGAGLNIPGGNHPTATRQNKISISREGIEVPKDINY
jgi:hypothetical protein